VVDIGQPGQNGYSAEQRRFAGQQVENRIWEISSPKWIPHLTPTDDELNQADCTRANQRGKSLFERVSANPAANRHVVGPSFTLSL